MTTAVNTQPVPRINSYGEASAQVQLATKTRASKDAIHYSLVIVILDGAPVVHRRVNQIHNLLNACSLSKVGKKTGPACLAVQHPHPHESKEALTQQAAFAREARCGQHASGPPGSRG